MKKMRNIVLVFAFTTLWHTDFEFKLLFWGSLISVAIVPELVIQKWYYATDNATVRKLRNNPRTNRYIHACGGVFNVLALFIIKLIGFGPGWDVMRQIIGIMMYKWVCVATFIGICFLLFCGLMIGYHFDYIQSQGYGWNTLLGLKGATETKKSHLE